MINNCTSSCLSSRIAFLCFIDYSVCESLKVSGTIDTSSNAVSEVVYTVVSKAFKQISSRIIAATVFTIRKRSSAGFSSRCSYQDILQVYEASHQRSIGIHHFHSTMRIAFRMPLPNRRFVGGLVYASMAISAFL